MSDMNNVLVWCLTCKSEIHNIPVWHLEVDVEKAAYCTSFSMEIKKRTQTAIGQTDYSRNCTSMAPNNEWHVQ
jgi:hypothetical protein